MSQTLYYYISHDIYTMVYGTVNIWLRKTKILNDLVINLMAPDSTDSISLL